MFGPFQEFFDDLRERIGCLGLAILLLLVGAGVIALGLLLNPFGGDDDAGGPEPGTRADATQVPASATVVGTVERSDGSNDGETPEPGSDDGGRTTRVGNIDLRLIDVLDRYDATQHSGVNTANVRIDLEATAVGDGGGYFTAFELALLDDSGAEYGASSCLDCPGNLDSLELAEGEAGAGAAYFELPEGREPAELIYRGSASGEEGRILLR